MINDTIEGKGLALFTFILIKKSEIYCLFDFRIREIDSAGLKGLVFLVRGIIDMFLDEERSHL